MISEKARLVGYVAAALLAATGYSLAQEGPKIRGLGPADNLVPHGWSLPRGHGGTVVNFTTPPEDEIVAFVVLPEAVQQDVERWLRRLLKAAWQPATVEAVTTCSRDSSLYVDVADRCWSRFSIENPGIRIQLGQDLNGYGLTVVVDNAPREPGGRARTTLATVVEAGDRVAQGMMEWKTPIAGMEKTWTAPSSAGVWFRNAHVSVVGKAVIITGFKLEPGPPRKSAWPFREGPWFGTLALTPTEPVPEQE